MRVVLAAAAALILPVAAVAGDIRVTYDVDAKALKKGLRGDGELRFDLHDDPGCNDRIARDDIEAVDLVIEEIETQKLKGGPKPPKRARITAVMEEVDDADAYFLTVRNRDDESGKDTIVPLGGSCQGQTAGAPGPEGPEGPQGPAGTFASTTCSRVTGDLIEFSFLGTAEDFTSTASCPPGSGLVSGGLTAAQAQAEQVCLTLQSEPNLQMTAWSLRMSNPLGSCTGAFRAVAVCCSP